MLEMSPDVVYTYKEVWLYFRRWCHKHNLTIYAQCTPETNKQIDRFCESFNNYVRVNPDTTLIKQYLPRKRNKPWALSSSQPIGWC